MFSLKKEVVHRRADGMNNGNGTFNRVDYKVMVTTIKVFWIKVASWEAEY